MPRELALLDSLQQSVRSVMERTRSRETALFEAERESGEQDSAGPADWQDLYEQIQELAAVDARAEAVALKADQDLETTEAALRQLLAEAETFVRQLPKK